MGWQSIQIVGASAYAIFILLQKIQKMVKCTFWYRLTRVVPDKVQRAVKWLCVCVLYVYATVCYLSYKFFFLFFFLCILPTNYLSE